MNGMKANELLSDERITARQESPHELNRLGISQDPLTQSGMVPQCRLATQLGALSSTLAQPPKRIFIVEDYPFLRDGLKQILNDAGDLMVCGTAGAVDQALPAIRRTKPDLVLADIDLPGTRGLELIKKLRSVDRSVKLLAISAQKEALHAAKVVRLGGDGYIMKQEDPDEIVHAIHDLLEGHIYVSEEVMEKRPGMRR